MLRVLQTCCRRPVGTKRVRRPSKLRSGTFWDCSLLQRTATCSSALLHSLHNRKSKQWSKKRHGLSVCIHHHLQKSIKHQATSLLSVANVEERCIIWIKSLLGTEEGCQRSFYNSGFVFARHKSVCFSFGYFSTKHGEGRGLNSNEPLWWVTSLLNLDAEEK